MSEPLQPWTGPDSEAPDEDSSGYLLMAGVLCGLIIAVGSHALAGHFAQRPELAAADPLLVGVVGVARWLGVAVACLCLGAWVRQLVRKKP